MKKFFLTFVILVILATAALYFAKKQIDAPNQVREWTTVQVASGATPVKIGNALAEKGLVSSSKLFSWWCRIQNVK